MTEIPKFKISCHALGTIMAEPRSKSETLSQGCKTYLKKWLMQTVTGKKASSGGKATEKGIEVEDDAIVFASIHLPEMGIACKNEKRYQNEYLIGTPDVVEPGVCVWDIKSSYSHDTFPLFESELPESDYDWQVLGYMALTGCHSGAVVYALMSTPENIIQREARFKLPEGYSMADYEAFAANYRYDELPAYLRLKVFEVNYDPEKIVSIRKRVEQCRDFIETKLWPELLKNKNLFDPA